MSDIFVRQATLNDTYAITDIHCSNIEGGVFTRRNIDGTRTPVPYEELTLFERYMSGGAWMSIETGAVWLAHILQYGDEIPLVVESNGLVLGYSEITIGHEPAPYRQHLHITTLQIHHDADNQTALANALLQYIRQMAQVMHIQLISVASSDSLFTDYGFIPQIVRKQAIVPAKEGRVVYKAIAIDDFNPQRIEKWYMPFGRYHNARHEWQHILPGFWNCIPELVEPEVNHYELALTGQAAIFLLVQDRYQSNQGHVYLWTERPLSSHMISAVRDRAARQGYEAVSLIVDNQTLAMVESDALEIYDVQVLSVYQV